MSLRSEVLDSLSALCEGSGVREGDIEVSLSADPIWIRVHDSPSAISLYRMVLDETPSSISLTESLHDYNVRSIVYRAFWEADAVFLRADIPAPISSSQLQVYLDCFDSEASQLEDQVCDVI
jgi:hypothetical protein